MGTKARGRRSDASCGGARAYPEGAHGAADLVFELVIAQDGSVGDVSVREGSEPFASAARRSHTAALGARGGDEACREVRCWTASARSRHRSGGRSE